MATKEAEGRPPLDSGRKLKFRIRMPTIQAQTTPAEPHVPPPKVAPTPEEEEEAQRRYQEELAAQERSPTPESPPWDKTTSSHSSTRSGDEPSVRSRRS